MSEWDMPIYVPKNQQNKQQPVQQSKEVQQQYSQQTTKNKVQYIPKAQVQMNEDLEEKKVNIDQSEQQKNVKIQNSKNLRFFDVAANLGSSQFAGFYKGKKFHDNDVKDVIQRANEGGCDRLLLSASNLKDAKECYQISQMSDKFYCTVGLHPAKANEADQNTNNYFNQLDGLIQKYSKKCVAVGECGLDYDRLFCSKKDVQIKVFEAHFNLSEKYQLPLYLHSRNSREDFLNIMQKNKKRFTNGLVHSYTGGIAELEELLQEGLYISINALTFKHKKDYEVVKRIPLDRIMIETDAPYCKIKPSDDGFSLLTSEEPQFIKKEKYQKGFFIQGRNEPYFVREVSQMLAAVLEKDEYEIAEQCYQNSLKFFNIQE
ncbi:hypothetical protein ABPG72_019768 [Tetrahymena utriculariae]